ncbi:heat stress transcription factor C-1b-like [Iris pallida]|uniref:Heat stress transcription factor C-1b-like n=1 Tax=Iris pallida TaxID=29817 RepID=A0AAX6HN38_IRIPA|nr:heat stress transcription factor C-1b-like [Iris pallida]
MEGIKSSSSDDQVHVVPFVAKTYSMVCEPRTDAIIRWGRDNNSFVVLDLPRFSQILLPSYFKHNNFSSFIRQLNTYGFRKVDPGQWEFAHEFFLRGETRLLPLIVRRRKKGCHGGKAEDYLEAENGEEETLFREVARLGREQRAIREELDDMSKRLIATERRPQQMVSFLIKVAQDPELLPRLVLSKKEQRKQQQKQQQQQQVAVDEKRWLWPDNSSSLPPLPQSLLEFQSREIMTPLIPQEAAAAAAAISSDSELISSITNEHHVGAPCSQRFFFPGFVDHEEAEECVAYPFSLLGQIFF